MTSDSIRPTAEIVPTTRPRLMVAEDADALVERIFAWRRGFNAMHVIDLGIENDLFSAFAAQPGATPAALATMRGLHATYLAVWCTGAHALGLLEAEADADETAQPGIPAGMHWRFRLAPFVEEVLARRSHPRYLGGYVQLGTRHASVDFGCARSAMRDGTTVPFQGRSEEFAELIAQSIAGVNMMVARKILPALPAVARALGDGGRLLDVGCGAGRLLLQIAKAFAAARCTGIDIDPTGLSAARDAIIAQGLQSRVDVIEGDLREAVAAEAFDVVVLVEVLHEIAPALRPEIVAACANALRPGGTLVIVDETHPSTPAQAREAAYQFPLQTALEEMLWGNVVPTAEEQEWLLARAGFNKGVERSMLGAGFTLLVAHKPD